jgi:hypothetical protein
LADTSFLTGFAFLAVGAFLAAFFAGCGFFAGPAFLAAFALVLTIAIGNPLGIVDCEILTTTTLLIIDRFAQQKPLRAKTIHFRWPEPRKLDRCK